MEVWADEERVRLARSQAVRNRRTARGLGWMSFLYLRLNSYTIQQVPRKHHSEVEFMQRGPNMLNKKRPSGAE